MKTVLFSLLFILYIICCDYPVGKNKERDVYILFPLTVGNSWTYKEIFTSIDTIITTEYTSIVTGYEKIGGYSWRKIVTNREDFIDERYLMYEDNKIYELQYNWNTPVRSLQYIIPKGSTETFGSIFGGDVGINRIASIIDTTISSQLGNFNYCYMYEYSTPDWTKREILAYGIGIVEIQVFWHPFHSEDTSTRITKLIDAEINIAP